MHFSNLTKVNDNAVNENEPDDETKGNFLKINEFIIPKVNHTKFLGVILDEELNWTYHIKALPKKTLMMYWKFKSNHRIYPTEPTQRFIPYSL